MYLSTCSLTAVPYPAETVAYSTLTPQSASRAPSPFLCSRAFIYILIRYRTRPTCASWCRQLSPVVAGARGYCLCKGAEAIGVFPSSQSQDLKKNFLKAPHPSHMLQLTPASGIYHWPWRNSAVIYTDWRGRSKYIPCFIPELGCLLQRHCSLLGGDNLGEWGKEERLCCWEGETMICELGVRGEHSRCWDLTLVIGPTGIGQNCKACSRTWPAVWPSLACQWTEVYPVVIQVDLDLFFLNKSS